MPGPTDDLLITFDSRADAIRLCGELIQQARQHICIHGPQLDPVLLNDVAILEQLKEFACRNRRTRIQILVSETQKNASQGHRLIALAQKLSSKIDIHIANPADQGYHQLVLIDTKSYWYCPTATRYQGRVAYHSATALKFQRDFDDYWQRSTADQNTRRLTL